MDYVQKFLQIEGVLGQGAFGRVLITSPLQNRLPSTPSPSTQKNTSHLLQSTLLASPNHHRFESRSELDTQKKQRENQRTIATRTLSATSTPAKVCHRSPASNKFNANGTTNLSPTNNGTRYALKCVHPILRPQRLSNELRVLRELDGKNNVVRMHTAHFYRGSLYIVMEMIEHDSFINIVQDLTCNEIRLYMWNLLIALQHVHQKNIVHRDIKPANFLYNRKNKKFLLVDFGLAQEIRPNPRFFPNSKPQLTSPATDIRSPSTQTIIERNLNVTPVKVAGIPTTPTSTNRRLVAAPPFQKDLPHESRKLFGQQNNQLTKLTKIPTVNLNSHLHTIHQQNPARHFISLSPTGSPSTPNVSTKRLMTDAAPTNDFNQMLKKLRVSGLDEVKEPVKLTVGAYESPVTCNDSYTVSNNKRNNTPHSHKFSTPTIPSNRLVGADCDCWGKGKTCSICEKLREPSAPKSGTPGYKAPEILLRYSYQTTAVDIWSSGVIMTCLLSAHTPIFRDVDDITSLAEIITLLGSQRITQTARDLRIKLNIEPKREPVDLEHLCTTLRSSSSEKLQVIFPSCAYDLLGQMLDPNPITRITAEEALNHPFFQALREDLD